MRKRIYAGLLTAAGLTAVALSVPSSAQRPADFITVSYKLDQVMQPKTWITTTNECFNNQNCAAALNFLGSLIGIPPSAMAIGQATARLTRADGDEEKYWDFPLPSGYHYCRAQINIVSMVPNDGARASVLAVGTHDTGLGASTWTPIRGSFDGTSWVEADFTIVGAHRRVIDDLRASGRCKMPDRELFNCRGKDGVDRAACKGVNIDQ